MNPAVGLEERRLAALRSVLDLATRDLNRSSDARTARERICLAVDIALRGLLPETVILTNSGLWFVSDMAEDEKLALARDVRPRLCRKLPAQLWKGLQLRS